jgi:hypothetical protein
MDVSVAKSSRRLRRAKAHLDNGGSKYGQTVNWACTSKANDKHAEATGIDHGGQDIPEFEIVWTGSFRTLDFESPVSKYFFLWGAEPELVGCRWHDEEDDQGDKNGENTFNLYGKREITVRGSDSWSRGNLRASQ